MAELLRSDGDLFYRRLDHLPDDRSSVHLCGATYCWGWEQLLQYGDAWDPDHYSGLWPIRVRALIHHFGVSWIIFDHLADIFAGDGNHGGD